MDNSADRGDGAPRVLGSAVDWVHRPWRRVVVKLSGEAFSGEEALGISPGVVQRIAREIVAVVPSLPSTMSCAALGSPRRRCRSTSSSSAATSADRWCTTARSSSAATSSGASAPVPGKLGGTTWMWTSKASGYCYGNRVMYIDAHDFSPLWEELYDAQMRLWKFQTTLPQRVEVPGVGPVVTPGFDIELIWDIQRNHASAGGESAGSVYVNEQAPAEFQDMARYTTRPASIS